MMGVGMMFRGAVAALAELLAPDGCFLCGHSHDPSLAAGFPSNRYAHALVGPVRARVFGMPLESHPVCPACAGGLREARHPVALEAGHRLISPFLDSPELVKLIHLLKFHGLRGMATPLGVAMAEALMEQTPPGSGAVLVPVPMDRRSRSRRGFNQAALLADEVGNAAALPVVHETLVKRRRTRAQSLTDQGDRDENVRNAFGTRGKSLRGCSVILVDDLVTTGATATACATVIGAAGATSVRVLAAGRAGAARGAGVATPGAPERAREREIHSP